MTELLILVRSALSGRPPEGAEYAALCRWDQPVWDMILEQARRQSVLGLVYVAVTLLPRETPVPEDISFILVAEGAAIEAKGRAMAVLSEKLLHQFRQFGCHPILMKGPETARLYAFPAFREYGDIDLYLPPGEMKKAITSLVAVGYAIEKQADGSFLFHQDGVPVDVHPSYYDLSCRPDRLPPPGTPESQLLMLSAHALKHATGTGLGLRQLCDSAAAFRALDGRYDSDAFLHKCRRVGILRWMRLQSRFLSVYLGTPDRLFPENRVSPEQLMDIVREGGNFGHYAENRRKALAGPPLLRKVDTARRFLRRLPFSLRYAPREILPLIWEIILRNIPSGSFQETN